MVKPFVFNFGSVTYNLNGFSVLKVSKTLVLDTNNGDDEDIMVIDMAADKISPSGTATELIPNGKWGIWYTVGSRSLVSSDQS